MATPSTANALARARIGEQRVDAREHLRHHDSRSGALHSAADDQARRGTRQAAPQRCQGEAQTPAGIALAAKDIAQPAAGDHQGGIGDLIDRDDRLDFRAAGVQIGADRRQRDIDDERIHDREELRRGHARQREPAAPG